MTCICWLHGSCPVDKPGDKHFLQPRSQGSLLPALRSVGLVGENPGNEFALSPFDTYESYNSTSNISSVLPTRHASKFLSPLNGSICPLYSSLCLKNYHFFHSYDSTTITRGLLQTRQAPKFPRGGAPGNSWWGCAARFFKSWPDFRQKNVILHTRFQTRTLKSLTVFQTWPLRRNYVITT